MDNNINFKKPKISYSLISVLIVVLIIILSGSYLFYVKSIPPEAQTKVRSNDMLSIDSIKSLAVVDTIKYFNKLISRIERDSTKQDSVIKTLNSEIGLKNAQIDTLIHRRYYRQKTTKDTIK